MYKPHFLIVAHGSRSQAWNNAVAEFAQQANETCHELGAFSGASACFMEFGRPSIPETIQALSQSHSEVIAQPLFLSVSQHVTVDIPNEFSSAAKQIDSDENQTRYQCGGCKIRLLTPPQAPELLAGNAARRIDAHTQLTPQDAVLFVYYGTKSYLPAWDALAQSTIDNLRDEFPGVKMTWCYAGDMVGFSSDPLANLIDKLTQECSRIVILPALVANGLIQKEVIPAAITKAQFGKKVLYFEDAILPDPHLAARFVEIAAANL
ncbi:hypothetical protein K8I31_01800 [bacterium]|nr:hypothetical protein [bacterium]